MPLIPKSPDESQRLEALRSYHILDTLEEKDFDELTLLASTICQVPVALISLVDEKRQWYKSHRGLSGTETALELSFCTHAITSPDDIFIIEDARQDERFYDNPQVTGYPNITFYAGVPLVNEQGYALGTLCIVDHEPRKLTAEQVTGLKIVGSQVIARLELRRKIIEIGAVNTKLAITIEALNTTNTELGRTKDSLQQVNEELEARVINRTKALADSEAKFRSLIEDNPVAMQVYRGDDMTFEINNAAMLQFLGKTADINGKPLFVGVPEIVGQPIVDMLYHVYRTGEPMEIEAIQVMLHRNGREETGYYNVSYRALYDNGLITGVLGIAIDVTAQVTARQALEESEEKLKIAVATGRMGTWSIATDSMKVSMSDFIKELLGLPLDKEAEMEAIMQAIDPEYHSALNKILSDAIHKNQPSDIEYTIHNLITNEQRWVRATGRVYPGANGKAPQYTGMFIDITEQKKVEQRKNDFIGMVSHELKTPLTSLNAYVQMLQSKAMKSEDSFAAGALDKAVKQIRKMTTMINGFLNLSRLEAGKINIDKQTFDMAALVKEAEEESHATVSSHNIVFEPAAKTLVTADHDKIGQVISNFISNAVKYSPAGSTIRVSCSIADGMAQLSVKDDGFGIEPQHIDQLFNRYYRVEGKHTRTISGFGIGLYICAEIIQRHEGRIWVESEAGKGSTFYFSLPLAG